MLLGLCCFLLSLSNLWLWIKVTNLEDKLFLYSDITTIHLNNIDDAIRHVDIKYHHKLEGLEHVKDQDARTV